MKAKLTKEEFDKLSDDFKKEYSADGDDYGLKIEGGEDTGALKRAKDHEKARRKEAEQKLTDVKLKLTEKQDEHIEMLKGAIPKDDVAALEKSWQEKLDTQKADLTGKLEISQNSVKAILVDSAARKLATEISTVPSLMEGLIKNRMVVEDVDGKSQVRILGTDGKPSALTFDDLKKEFVDNKEYASIIVGSQASGSGAQGSGKGGGAATKFSDMNEGDRVSLYKSDPDAYRKLRDSDKPSEG